MNSHTIIEPAFPNSHNAILLASNDGFMKYASVMIQSIIDHSTHANNYDIVLFYKEIANDNKEKLLRMVTGHDNFSLRIINVRDIVSVFGSLFIERSDAKLSEETYYRLLAPDVFSTSYDRVIYLDCDMVMETDVAELYDVDIDNYYLAASRDVCGNASCHASDTERLKYRQEELKLACTDDYFIAGLLVMNLNTLRRDYPDYALMKLAMQRNWRQHDQDVLNYVCRDNGAKIIHASWNVLQNYVPNTKLPEPYYTEWIESEREPKVIHYGGSGKPFKRDVIRQEAFWKIAATTEFFQQIITEMIHAQLPYEISSETLNPVISRIQADIISGNLNPKFSSILSEIAQSELFARDSEQNEICNLILSLVIEKSKLFLSMETKRDAENKLKRRYAELLAEKKQLAKDNKRLARRVDSITGSISFRLGQAITKLPRIIRDFLRRK